jgi:hypothetical protein
MIRSGVTVWLALIAGAAGPAPVHAVSGADVCRNHLRLNGMALPVPDVVVRTGPGGPCPHDSPDRAARVQPRLIVTGGPVDLDVSIGANWF